MAAEIAAEQVQKSGGEKLVIEAQVIKPGKGGS
jgi:hypothetical protein